MNRSIVALATAALVGLPLATSLGASEARSPDRARDATLAVTMTNETGLNQIKVYDAMTRELLQTLPAGGSGGVGGNARGVRQYNGEIFAAVNNGSNSVAVFVRKGNRLKLDKIVSTTSAPVSVDFGNGHMYVANATTVDSFVVHGNSIGVMDGTTQLQLAGGGAPPSGSTAQVGVVDEGRLLVTLKTDPAPGTVDVVDLHNGAIVGAPPATISAPNGTLTPFGFAVYPDGTAVITLAHSDQDGLFRNGAFKTVVGAGQMAPCWMTRSGKYLFTANTGSRTVSRLVATGNNVFVDALTPATIATGGSPSDIDADGGVLGVIDRGGGSSHLSLFYMNDFGELAQIGVAIDLTTANANGIAIMSPFAPDED